MFQRTLPFTLYRNNELYGKFFINTSKSNTDKTLYDLRISDYIQILEKQTFLGGLYTNKTVSSLVAEILGDIPYTLDSTLGAYTLTGYLPILSKRDALQEIAFATNGYVDTSRSDQIVINPLPEATARTVTPSEIVFIETTQQNIVTRIELETEKLTQKQATADEIFTGTISGLQTIIFDTPKYNLTITGGTIVSSNINYAIINGSGAVTLSGKDYEITNELRVKENPFVVSTDLENIDKYTATLTCNNIDILDKLNFVEFTIRSVFKMENTKIGDLISLNGEVARVMQLSYDLKQTNIYAEAELEKYYAIEEAQRGSKKGNKYDIEGNTPINEEIEENEPEDKEIEEKPKENIENEVKR